MVFILSVFVVVLLGVYFLVEGERQDWWEKRPYLRPILIVLVAVTCAAGALAALFLL